MNWNWPFGNTARDTRAGWPLALLSEGGYVTAEFRIREGGELESNPISSTSLASC